MFAMPLNCEIGIENWRFMATKAWTSPIGIDPRVTSAADDRDEHVAQVADEHHRRPDDHDELRAPRSVVDSRSNV
jgi:hypothetical protein